MVTLEEAAGLKISLGLEISTRCFPGNPNLPHEVMLRNDSFSDVCVVKYHSDGRIEYEPALRTFDNDYRTLLRFIVASLKSNKGIIDNEELSRLLSARKDSPSSQIFYISTEKS